MTTSSDGGNLISLFRAAERTESARSDPENYARVAAIVRHHSLLKYCFSPYPYTAPLGRLRTYLTDRRVAATCTTSKEVLDKLIDAQLKLRPTAQRAQPNGRAQL
jgi:hypothetical protein